MQHRTWPLFLALGSVCALAYSVVDDDLVKAVIAVGLSAAGLAAILVGIRRYAPVARRVWLVLAAGQVSWLVGWILWEEAILETGAPPAIDSPVILFSLGGLVVTPFVGLVLLRRREATITPVLDAVMVFLAVGAVAWATLVFGYLDHETVSHFGQAIQISYAIVDVLLLALVARLAVSPGARKPAFLLLLASAAAVLVSDVIWNWSVQLGSYSPGSWADAGWLLYSAFLGAMALHPSMRTLFEPEPAAADTRLRWSSIVVLAAAAAVPPILLGSISSIDDEPVQVVPVTIAATLLSLVVVARMALALRERRRLAATLASQNEQLRELDRLKDDFVASVSHELRTPLTSIRGYTELLLDGDAGELTDDQKRFLGIVDRNSERLLTLVGDLLFVAQVDAGKLALDVGEVDLRRLAADSVEALRPRAEGAGITLGLDAPVDVPATADRARVAQLLDNLVSNALKFTPQGGTVVVRAFSDGSNACLEVADTGVGIPEDEQGRLFERFFRATYATEHAVAGTGLGLAITKAIAAGHGGDIHVRSRVGEGTTFRVELPAQRVPAATRAREEVLG